MRSKLFTRRQILRSQFLSSVPVCRDGFAMIQCVVAIGEVALTELSINAVPQVRMVSAPNVQYIGRPQRTAGASINDCSPSAPPAVVSVAQPNGAFDSPFLPVAMRRPLAIDDDSCANWMRGLQPLRGEFLHVAEDGPACRLIGCGEVGREIMEE